MSGAGRLAGRVALITGASSGIGAGTARRFVAEGCRVVIADVQHEAGAIMAEELGASAWFASCDVTSEEDVAAAVDSAVERFGRLDIMFNNAGIIGATGPIARSVMADVDLTVAVNLRGTFLGMKHAARVMEANHSGVILSTSSPAGLVGGLGAHAYSAAKAGVIGLTQSVAAELRPKGIRVNAIVPGAIVTAMTADIVVGDPGDLSGAAEVLQASALMSRPGLPDDIAAAASVPGERRRRLRHGDHARGRRGAGGGARDVALCQWGIRAARGAPRSGSTGPDHRRAVNEATTSNAGAQQEEWMHGKSTGHNQSGRKALRLRDLRL